MPVLLYAVAFFVYAALAWGMIDQYMRLEMVERHRGRRHWITWGRTLVMVWVLLAGCFLVLRVIFAEVVHTYLPVLAFVCGMGVRLVQFPSARDVRRMAVMLGSTILRERGLDPATVNIRGLLEDAVEDIEANNGYGHVPGHSLGKRHDPMVLMFTRPPFCMSVAQIERVARNWSHRSQSVRE